MMQPNQAEIKRMS